MVQKWSEGSPDVTGILDFLWRIANRNSKPIPGGVKAGQQSSTRKVTPNPIHHSITPSLYLIGATHLFPVGCLRILGCSRFFGGLGALGGMGAPIGATHLLLSAFLRCLGWMLGLWLFGCFGKSVAGSIWCQAPNGSIPPVRVVLLGWSILRLVALDFDSGLVGVSGLWG